MKKLLIIGDVHGKVNEFLDLLGSHHYDIGIQLGDLGFKKEHDLFKKERSKRDFVLFGNHDHYPYLNESYSLGDFRSFKITENVFCVRGAYSIDKHLRTEGVDWFREEEMDYVRFRECIEQYVRELPEIVISHDAPEIARKKMFGVYDKSITSSALQQMFEEHKPRTWVFGHHHEYKEKEIDGTRFICLEELGHLYLPI